MRNPGGYGVWHDPDADQPIKEVDSYSCGHCQYVVFVGAKKDPAALGGLCKVCMRLVCPRCTAAGECKPFEKMLEEIEARGRARKSLGA